MMRLGFSNYIPFMFYFDIFYSNNNMRVIIANVLLLFLIRKDLICKS